MAHDPDSTADEDADIVALLREGAHGPAFDQLAARYAPRLYRLCNAFVRDPALAEDVAQEALVRIWRALPSFDGRARLSTWIYAIARNRSLTALSRRRPADSLSDELAAEVPATDPGPDALADGGAVQLRQFVDALPERQRIALTLYYYEDRSVADVAAGLGIPEATVKTHLARGRAQLLARLQAAGLAEVSTWLN